MSYRKRKYYKKKKKYKGYHPYIRASAPAMGYIAMKAAEKVVKKYVNTEFKHYDINGASLDIEAISGNGQTILLNPIPPVGSTAGNFTSQEREGQQVKMVSVNVKGVVRGNANNDNKIKIQLWVENDPGGRSAVPTLSDLYDFDSSTGGAITATNYISCMREISTTHKYRLLKTITIVTNKNGKSVYDFNMYYKFPKGLITKWNEESTIGTITNIQKGAIYMTYLSDRTTDNFPTLNYVSRVRFIDN